MGLAYLLSCGLCFASLLMWWGWEGAGIEPSEYWTILLVSLIPGINVIAVAVMLYEVLWRWWKEEK